MRPWIRLFTCGTALLLAMAMTIAVRAENPSATTKDSVSLLVLGDWGIDAPARVQVGEAMATYAAAADRQPDAALLLGDNFYVKLTGIDDPKIQTFFEKTYDPTRLNIPFYAVMGNHDYKENNVQIEMDYAKRPGTRLKIPSKWYRLDLPVEKPLVTVLMLDSDAPPAPLMDESEWKAELQWLTEELAKPHAKWLVCAAHHDMFGNGSHGDNGVLQTTWGPLFKKAGVDLYVCGHEHTLQHLQIPGWSTSFVVAGGGGAKTKPMLRDLRGPFSRSVTGFASMRFTQEAINVQLVSGEGKVVHEFTRDSSGTINVLRTTPSDKATTQPIKVIQGIEESGKKSKDAD